MRLFSFQSEKGSALFLILIGVALFASLSYTVAGMLRSGGGGDVVDEKSKLYANEIIDYGRTVRQAIQNMRISNGCSDTAISFENAIVTGYTNGTNTACQVFHADGGGLQWLSPNTQAMEDVAQTWIAHSEHCYDEVGTGVNAAGCLADSKELSFDLPGIKKTVCISINAKLGIDNPGGDPPEENHIPTSANKFTGSYADGADADHFVTTAQTAGQMVGCYKDNAGAGNGSYVFYQILIPR